MLRFGRGAAHQQWTMFRFRFDRAQRQYENYRGYNLRIANKDPEA